MTGEFYDYPKVAELVQQYCTQHGILKRDYAALIEVEPESLSRITAGKNCSIEALAKISLLSKTQLGSLLKEAPSWMRDKLLDAAKLKNLPICI